MLIVRAHDVLESELDEGVVEELVWTKPLDVAPRQRDRARLSRRKFRHAIDARISVEGLHTE